MTKSTKCWWALIICAVLITIVEYLGLECSDKSYPFIAASFVITGLKK